MDISPDRRPLKTRSANWAKSLAAILAKADIAPDFISFFGIVFAAAGAALFSIIAGSGCAPCRIMWLSAAACIQLRLLCNMLDGMVATEWKKKSPYGGIWNEVPDRVEDVLFLASAGYAVGMAWLGFLCAIAAVSTAYIRAFGFSLTGVHDFRGPMAKPHRMFALTCGCLLAAAVVPWGYSIAAMQCTLAVILAGSIATCVRRLTRTAKLLKQRSDDAR